MPDPVAQRNAARPLAEHRVDDIRFRSGNADLTCSCGWNRTWEIYIPGEVESAWAEHRRLNGARTK